jgi:ABC-2 type transport system ATP-binding protein
MERNSDIAIDSLNLSKTYPGRVALSDITFSVKRGSVHGFLGPNGAGKSTTMKILTGLIPQTSGEFFVNGKIGFLPEHPPLYPNMSVQDYLKFVLDIYSPTPISQTKSREIVQDVMEKTGLIHVAERLIGNLSKGYQQRVGIAQALVHSPEIIILDEPTVGLDPSALAEIRDLITKLKNDHTILFSTHQLHDVELLCSDITLINNGKIVVSGPLDSIINNLKTRMNIEARVLHFNEELKKKMLTNFKLDLLDFKKNEEKDFLLTMTVAAPESLKAELSRFLSQENIGLLEFTEIRLSLEELFKQMIH